MLEALFEIFPEADLYTLLYDERAAGSFRKNIKGTSFLDNPAVRRRHRVFIPLMPLAAKNMKIGNDYDLILSSSAGYGKGFNHQSKKAFHISYCYTPLRYAWEIDYLKNIPFSPWPLNQYIAHPIAKALRRWDKRAAENVNVFVAVSGFIAEKIKSYYGRESEIVYPPVDTEVFYPDFQSNYPSDYYLMVGRLLYYKLFDLGIKAFNALRKPLKIVGSGPEAEKLKSIAGDNIEFIDRISDKGLRMLYSNARAFIFPQIEDFGLVAAEAQACGTPVIAYRKGGGVEIVEDKKTGIFFDNQSVDSLTQAVREFEKQHFDRSYIAKSAQRFSKEKFKEGIIKVVKSHGFRA